VDKQINYFKTINSNESDKLVDDIIILMVICVIYIIFIQSELCYYIFCMILYTSLKQNYMYNSLKF